MKQVLPALLLFVVLVTLGAMPAQAQEKRVDLYGVCSLALPPEFELYRISSNVEHSINRGRYGLVVHISYVYARRLGNLTLAMWSRQPPPISGALKEAPVVEYPDESFIGMSVQALGTAHVMPFDLGHGAIGIREARPWPTKDSVDMLGYLLPGSGAVWGSCSLLAFDAWDAFGTGSLPEDAELDSILPTQSQVCIDFYLLMNNVARSISSLPQPADLSVTKPDWTAPSFVADGDVCVPTIPNLRYRSGPGLKAGVLGTFLPKDHLRILSRGQSQTIDGIKGNWVRATFGADRWGAVVWVFDGYLRAVTPAERQKGTPTGD